MCHAYISFRSPLEPSHPVDRYIFFGYEVNAPILGIIIQINN